MAVCWSFAMVLLVTLTALVAPSQPLFQPPAGRVCGLRSEAKLERPRRSTRSISPTLPTRQRLRLRRAAQLQEKGIYRQHPRSRPRKSADSGNSRQLPTPTEAFNPLPVGANGANRPQPIAQQQQISSHIPMKTQGVQHHDPPTASIHSRHSLDQPQFMSSRQPDEMPKKSNEVQRAQH